MNGCGDIGVIDVPVRYGSTDRVATSLGASNTQNKLPTLPLMSVYLQTIETAPERMHGIGHLDRRSYLEQGGTFPDDVKALQRMMPVPYNLTYELAIHASNTEQAYQILEQILILFDYDLQIQMNDAPFDWAKITRVSLTGINNEEQYPGGTDLRNLVWTMNFQFETWLSLPIAIRNEIIKNINIKLGDPDAYTMQEYGEDGELVPFMQDGSYDDVNVKYIIKEDSGPGMIDEVREPFFNTSLVEECHEQPIHN